ncbi:MAG: hypothetical protein EON58_05980 [Alphaproteobacteria bacterium]|nr:MAG: hypothetical protein EON58_05980 [Alphaproteobacteria bacterium]
MEVDIAAQAATAAELLENAAYENGGLENVFARVAETLGGRMFHLYNYTNIVAPELIVAPEAVGIYHDYIDRGWHQHDTYSHRAAAVVRHGHVVSDTDFLSSNTRARDPFYQDFCPSWGIGGFVASTFDLCGQNWSFTLMTREGAPPTVRDKQALQILAPAANRACFLAASLRDARTIGFANGIEKAGKSALVLDHNGKVTLITPSAMALLGEALAIQNNCLKSDIPENARLLNEITAAAKSRHQRLLRNFLLVREAARAILVMPIYSYDRMIDGLPGSRLVLMLLDLERRNAPLMDHLKLCFDLSSREAQLAVLLAQGQPLHECAAVLDVTQNTIRQMMKSVSSKTNTHSQVELTALLRGL